MNDLYDNCFFHVVFVKSIQTKHVILIRCYWTVSSMFMNVKMFIIILDSCIVFEMIHFIPPFCITNYESIDTSFVELTLF